VLFVLTAVIPEFRKRISRDDAKPNDVIMPGVHLTTELDSEIRQIVPRQITRSKGERSMP
jgi:hypothetical protein